VVLVARRFVARRMVAHELSTLLMCHEWLMWHELSTLLMLPWLPCLLLEVCLV